MATTVTAPATPFEVRFKCPGVDMQALRKTLGLLAETMRNWDRPVVLWCRSALNEALLTEFPQVRNHVLGIVDPDNSPEPFHGVPAIDPMSARDAGLAFIGQLNPQGAAASMLVRAAGLAHPAAAVWTLKDFGMRWSTSRAILRRVMERNNLPLTPQPIVITAASSCGLNWAYQVLAQTGLPSIATYAEIQQTGQVAQLGRLRPGTMLADHLAYDETSAAMPAGAKLIVCIRDPRDSIVSSYFYHLEVRKDVSGSFDEYFAEALDIMPKQFERMAMAWLSRPGTLCIRYEDVVRSEGAVARSVLQHAGVPMPDWLRNVFVTQSSFKVQSGRERGEVGAGQHLRRGGLGYYREMCSEAQLREYAARCGDLHRALGYTFDDDGDAKGAAQS